MPMNTNEYAPRIRPFAFDEDLGRQTLNGLIIMAVGTVDVTDIDGNDATITIPADSTNLPFHLCMQIATVHATSSVPLADLIGLH